MKTTKYETPVKVEYDLLSDCCGWPPLNGIYNEGGWNDDGGEVTGYCSKCKDGSGFQWYKQE